jgi:type IV secretory pathway VirB2 component (pilin)
MFVSPNSSSIMSSVPARHRGAASGMRSTFQNSGTALSIGVFFSLMIIGLAHSLPATLTSGLQRQGVPHAVAHHIGTLPPVSSLFAAVLGVNPVQHLLSAAHALSSLPPASQRVLTGREFFPALISGPFQHGLAVVFAVAAGLSAVAAVASLLRGGRYVHPETAAEAPAGHPGAGPAAVLPGPAAVPDGPAADPGRPAAVPDGPAAVPDGPAAVLPGPVADPDGPAAGPGSPARAGAEREAGRGRS